MASSSSTFPFLELPRELRDQIYTHVVGSLCRDVAYLESSHIHRARIELASRYGTAIPDKALDTFLQWTSASAPKRPGLGTPSILLLNRQIFSEVIPLLRLQCLRINAPISSNLRRDVKGLEIIDFISEETLSAVHYAHIELSFRSAAECNNWERTISQLNRIWSRKNALKELKISIRSDGDLDPGRHEWAVGRRWAISRVGGQHFMVYSELMDTQLLDLEKVAPTVYASNIDVKRRGTTTTRQ